MKILILFRQKKDIHIESEVSKCNQRTEANFNSTYFMSKVI